MGCIDPAVRGELDIRNLEYEGEARRNSRELDCCGGCPLFPPDIEKCDGCSLFNSWLSPTDSWD